MPFLPLKSKPSIMQLEPTNDCNSYCKICMRGFSGREVGYMKFEDFKRLPLNKFKEVALHGWGEPLLHPDLFKMISHVKSLGIKVSVITNGILLGDKIEQILTSGLDSLAVGIFTLNGKSKILDDVRRLREEARSRGSRLEIFFDVTILLENLDEIPEIVKAGKEVGVDGVVLHRLFNLHEKLKHIGYPSKDEEQKLFEKLRLLGKEVNLKVYLPTWSHEIPCRVIRNCIYVTWDCKQSPCCFLCELGYFLGKVEEDPFKKHADFMRRMKDVEACRSCPW